MLFVALAKIKGKVTPELVETAQNSCKNPPPGIKYHSVLCTLGQYDFVFIIEAPNVKEIMKLTASWTEFCDTQTMVAVPFDEAIKLFE
jgi:uncharacterized protein with GYD domain